MMTIINRTKEILAQLLGLLARLNVSNTIQVVFVLCDYYIKVINRYFHLGFLAIAVSCSAVCSIE